MNLMIICTYNLSILAGTAYLVHNGWSAWTFLPAFLLLGAHK